MSPRQVLWSKKGKGYKIKWGDERMEGKKTPEREPDPDRLLALKSLPAEVMARLTKEEVNAFLFEEVWPDSLQDKLMGYLVDEAREE